MGDVRNRTCGTALHQIHRLNHQQVSLHLAKLVAVLLRKGAAVRNLFGWRNGFEVLGHGGWRVLGSWGLGGREQRGEGAQISPK